VAFAVEADALRLKLLKRRHDGCQTKV
jgi:hypothetical protein